MEVVVIVTWIGMLIASLVSTPDPTTTVVLVDNGKRHNAIVVQTKAGSVVVDKAGNYVDLLSSTQKPSEIKSMTQAQIDEKFKSVIVNAPLKPVTILLYFENNSNNLTNASLDKLPQIFKEIKARVPADVNIIGHTDTKGSDKINNKLSLKRAIKIKKWLTKKNINLKDLSVNGYGESDLLVNTADNVSEAKNRRVEIFIK